MTLVHFLPVKTLNFTRSVRHRLFFFLFLAARDCPDKRAVVLVISVCVGAHEEQWLAYKQLNNVRTELYRRSEIEVYVVSAKFKTIKEARVRLLCNRWCTLIGIGALFPMCIDIHVVIINKGTVNNCRTSAWSWLVPV